MEKRKIERWEQIDSIENEKKVLPEGKRGFQPIRQQLQAQ